MGSGRADPDSTTSDPGSDDDSGDSTRDDDSGDETVATTTSDRATGDGRVQLVPSAGDWPERVRRDLEATDWAATPVVDVVHYAPATTTGLEGGHARIEVHRHGGTPPSPARYATPERSCRVERMTRPLFARLARAHD